MSEDKLKQGLLDAKELLNNKSTEKKPNSPFFKYNNISGDLNIHEVEIEQLVKSPNDWNFYTELSDNKMQELIDSILANGLLHPIVVWEQDDGSYMILSGHNRVKAYEMIYLETSDERFFKIPALIKKQNEIDEIQAREIIIDTNWVSRQLNPIEKSLSITNKYVLLRQANKKFNDGDGRIRDRIAEEYNLSGRQVDNYRKLTALIPDLQNMLKDKSMGVKAGIKLSSYDTDMQQWIFENFKDKLSANKIVNKIKSNMNKESLCELFSDKPESDMIKITVEIPKELESQFKDMINIWMADNCQNMA